MVALKFSLPVNVTGLTTIVARAVPLTVWATRPLPALKVAWLRQLVVEQVGETVPDSPVNVKAVDVSEPCPLASVPTVIPVRSALPPVIAKFAMPELEMETVTMLSWPESTVPPMYDAGNPLIVSASIKEPPVIVAAP